MKGLFLALFAIVAVAATSEAQVIQRVYNQHHNGGVSHLVGTNPTTTRCLGVIIPWKSNTAVSWSWTADIKIRDYVSTSSCANSTGFKVEIWHKSPFTGLWELDPDAVVGPSDLDSNGAFRVYDYVDTANPCYYRLYIKPL